MKRKLSILIFFLLLALPIVQACFFVPPNPHRDDDLFIPEQKALIIHDGASQELIVQPRFEGDHTEFAWVIPTPARPEVQGRYATIFRELHELTKPYVREAPEGIGMALFSSRGFASSAGFMDQVHLLERQQIGVFDVSTLSSEDPKALRSWLVSNGYAIPEEAEASLSAYVEEGWYFVAVRIDLSPADEALITSLQSIDEQITDAQSAQERLTQLITTSVTEEKQYTTVPAFRTQIEIEDPEETLEERDFRYQRAPVPNTIINEYSYMRMYTDYNGLDAERMDEHARRMIESAMDSATSIPYRSACRIARYLPEDCDVYLYEGDHAEVERIRAADCGLACTRIADEQEQYTPEELAEVAARAVVNGDEELRAYYGLSIPEQEWYEKESDLRTEYERRIEYRLQSRQEPAIQQRKEEKRAAYAQQLSEQLGTQGGYVEIQDYLAQELLDALAANTSLEQTTLYEVDIITAQSAYKSLLFQYHGHQNETQLRQEAKEHVENLLSWKTDTTTRRLSEGSIQPLGISFTAQEPVYPLRISSHAQASSEILLYTLTDHRMQTSNYGNRFKTEYAGRLSADELRVTSERQPGNAEPVLHYGSQYEQVAKLGAAGKYLTKLRANIPTEDMQEDVRLEQAPDDDPVRITVLEDGYFILWPLFLVGLCFFTLFMFIFYLGPHFLLNYLFHRGKYAAARINWKQHAIYAAIIPAIFGVASILYSFDILFIAKAFGAVVEVFLEEIILASYKLLRFLFVPAVLAVIILVAFWPTMLLALHHYVHLGVKKLIQKRHA